MSYLVMECHPGYAVVLDQDGRFLKVANLNYDVGQTVLSVMEMSGRADSGNRKPTGRRFAALASLAACLGVVLLGSWHALMTPYGSVRMQINPDVQITVNRLDYVIDLEGMNEDGENLISGYRYGMKKVDQTSDELADRAMEMGYLQTGGTIYLTVESEHDRWRTETADRIILELEVHTGNSIAITAGEKPSHESTAEPPDQQNLLPPDAQEPNAIPAPPSVPDSGRVTDDDDGNDQGESEDADDREDWHEEESDSQDDDTDEQPEDDPDEGDEGD